jgi:hypothetical protein
VCFYSDKIIDNKMELVIKKIIESLNPAYRKTSIKREEIELFKANFKTLFLNCEIAEKKNESEEHFKNIVSDFLKDTYFKNNFFVNTEKRKDLVIHQDSTSESPIGVIVEVKRPSNKLEMISSEKTNVKALHELVHYYLQERYVHKNQEIKHLIITNIFEWYIFDGKDFEKFFFENPKLIKSYKEWIEGQLGLNKTDWFYQEIAKTFIDELSQLSCTYFNLTDFKDIVNFAEQESEKQLIDLYKIFSPEHLLKKPFANDSNTLNKEFYNELLHILGLEEAKDGGKKIIQRITEGTRHEGSLLENIIHEIEHRHRLMGLGSSNKEIDNSEETVFSNSLELCITWLNRILFVKLLEGQLIKYHKNDRKRAFLNISKIKDFHELNELFFEVLATQFPERTKSVQQKFGNIPYLNSSLFEPSELERQYFFISCLKERLLMPVYQYTVLKDSAGKRITGSKKTLEYLFEFLDAYDFSSDGNAEIQEENKTLINASVLGLIFEKINGYKDGSFFTPGFITMYMCCETIRKAVVRKFNEKCSWNCQSIEDLKEKIDYTDKEQRKKANEIINSIKICDPSVGSGHFLVSALNELIAVKSELQILQHLDNSRIKEYKIEIENDELVITNKETNQLFEYRLNQKNYPIEDLQKFQEALFHEKQRIIENCLFGVDINPKSVIICRLRLWIELLKNAYYTQSSNYTELETLPNIDINIKCGNSLIYRFDIQDSYAQLPASTKQKIKLATAKYKEQVILYKSTTDKIVKRKTEQTIKELKETFIGIANPSDNDYKKWKEAEAKLGEMPLLFSREEQEAWKKKTEIITEEVNELKIKYEQKLKTLYKNAFEWRFEFPEVLDEDGIFVGFDIVIGNPPYINIVNISERIRNYYQSKYSISKNKVDTYAYFIELMNKISSEKGNNSMIIPITWKATESFILLRKFILDNYKVDKIVNLDFGVFDAVVKPLILILQKNFANDYEIEIFNKDFDYFGNISKNEITADENLTFDTDNPQDYKKIFSKIEQNTIQLQSIIQFSRGIKTSDDNRFIKLHKEDEDCKKIFRGRNIKAYQLIWDNEWIWYKPSLMKEKVGSLPHKPTLFEVPEKLVTQRVNSSMQLLVAYDEMQNYFLDTVNVSRYETWDKKHSLKFILALLNSKMVNFWYCNKFRMPTIGLYELHSIPIKETSKNKQKPFIKLVDEILELKKQNPKADTSKQEMSIDKLVYELYELTDEEVKIIEGNI